LSRDPPQPCLQAVGRHHALHLFDNRSVGPEEEEMRRALKAEALLRVAIPFVADVEV
jgi:hypothetical protein